MGRKVTPNNRYIGKPCKYGHIERYIATGECVACKVRNAQAARDRDRKKDSLRVSKSSEITENKAGEKKISGALVNQLRLQAAWDAKPLEGENNG